MTDSSLFSEPSQGPFCEQPAPIPVDCGCRHTAIQGAIYAVPPTQPDAPETAELIGDMPTSCSHDTSGRPTVPATQPGSLAPEAPLQPDALYEYLDNDYGEVSACWYDTSADVCAEANNADEAVEVSGSAVEEEPEERHEEEPEAQPEEEVSPDFSVQESIPVAVEEEIIYEEPVKPDTSVAKEPAEVFEPQKSAFQSSSSTYQPEPKAPRAPVKETPPVAPIPTAPRRESWKLG